MNDLISREAAITYIKDHFCNRCDTHNGMRCCFCDAGNAMSVLKDVPAVDAVEVVRCKDCIHWIDGACGNFSHEDGTTYFTPSHGYCYAAEKEEDDDE